MLNLQFISTLYPYEIVTHHSDFKFPDLRVGDFIILGRVSILIPGYSNTKVLSNTNMDHVFCRLYPESLNEPYPCSIKTTY